MPAVHPPEWDDAHYELPLATATLPTISTNNAIESLLPPPPLEVVTRKSFVAEFVKSKGPPQIVILVILLALGFGSTIGVVSVLSVAVLLLSKYFLDGNRRTLSDTRTTVVCRTHTHRVSLLLLGSGRGDGSLRSLESWLRGSALLRIVHHG
jgi:hypothetical protein